MTAVMDTKTAQVWFCVQVMQTSADGNQLPLRTYDDVDSARDALEVFDRAVETFRREIQAGRALVRFTATTQHVDHSGPAEVHPFVLPAGAALDDDVLRHFGVGSV